MGPTCNHSSARTKTVRKQEKEKKKKKSKSNQSKENSVWVPLALNTTTHEWGQHKRACADMCVRVSVQSRAQYMCVWWWVWDKVAETLGTLWDHRLQCFHARSEWLQYYCTLSIRSVDYTNLMKEKKKSSILGKKVGACRGLYSVLSSHLIWSSPNDFAFVLLSDERWSFCCSLFFYWIVTRLLTLFPFDFYGIFIFILHILKKWM